MSAEVRPAALVTGVAGFLGSHLAEALLARGHAVRGVDAFTPYYARSLKEANLEGLRQHPGFRFLELDLRQADLGPVLEGVDWVFHQAAQPGVRASWDEGFADYVGHNLLGTQRLLEAARRSGVARFVFASSSSVYGNVPAGEVDEDAPLRPMSPYGVTKMASEKLVHVYHREFGLHTVSLRYFTVCGPRQRPDMAFHKILRALHLEQEFPQYGDGSQERDFTYVGDAVNANLLAAERGRPGAVYNIGGGHPVSLAFAVDTLSRVTGRRARIRILPRAEGDPDRTAASLERAREDLGYAPAVRGGGGASPGGGVVRGTRRPPGGGGEEAVVSVDVSRGGPRLQRGGEPARTGSPGEGGAGRPGEALGDAGGGRREHRRHLRRARAAGRGDPGAPGALLPPQLRQVRRPGRGLPGGPRGADHHHGRRPPGRPRRDPGAAGQAGRGLGPGLGLEAGAPRSRLQDPPLQALQPGHRPATPGSGSTTSTAASRATGRPRPRASPSTGSCTGSCPPWPTGRGTGSPRSRCATTRGSTDRASSAPAGS